MKAIMPKDMAAVWQEDDGGLYFIPGYYSDADRCLKVKGASTTVSGVTFNQPMYKAIGSPAFTTLEDYRKVLKAVKAKYPTLTYYAYNQPVGVQDSTRNFAQQVARIYGGGALRTIAADGTVHLNFRDAPYLKALKFVNSLYRDGLFNKENFTITTMDQHAEIVKNQKVFSVWGQPFNSYTYDMSETGNYRAMKPPMEPGTKLHWPSVTTGVGGWPLAAIAQSTKNPSRAIKYYEFMMSDEGQMLTYHGIEGKDYTMVDGMPKNSPEKDDMWHKNFGQMQKEMGILNYQIAWFPTNLADSLYYFWLNKSNPGYAYDVAANGPYATNERANELIRVLSDTPEKVIETKVFDLWTQSLPGMYLADSEAEVTKKLNDFIAQAEKLGLKQLEAAYTADSREWMKKLGGK